MVKRRMNMKGMLNCNSCNVLNPEYNDYCVFCGVSLNKDFFSKLDSFLTKHGLKTIILTDDDGGEVTVWENKKFRLELKTLS